MKATVKESCGVKLAKYAHKYSADIIYNAGSPIEILPFIDPLGAVVPDWFIDAQTGCIFHASLLEVEMKCK